MISFDPNAGNRIPFFTFKEIEFGVDAEQSRVKGYDVPMIKTFILITPHGHKGDPMEFVAQEFIERKEKQCREGTYQRQWVDEFKNGLESYRAGREIPRHGMYLMNWERILKRRREDLVTKFPTVEDLAAVPDSGLGEIGLDGRVLRDLARTEVQARVGLEPIVKELAETKEENRRLQEQMTSLLEKFRILQTSSQQDHFYESPNPAPRPRGRPKTVDPLAN